MNSTLFARWSVVNALLLALFITGYAYGALDRFLIDDLYITHGILTISFIAIVCSGFTAFRIQSKAKHVGVMKALYDTQRVQGRGEDHKEVLADQLLRPLSSYTLIGPVLVSLGLLGTVVGISMAFSGISPDVIADIQASQGVMALLLSGLATAFHTTLAGMVGMIWNMINLHMMKQESSRLYTAVLNGGE